jgi:hypothetical protein
MSRDEAAGKAVRRVLREQNARVLTLLKSWKADPADAIHRARQGCKRARAVAQLLKPAAPYVARVENAFYREIQQRVGYARDTEAIVEAIDFLEIGVSEPLLAESVGMLRESLAVRAVREVEQHRASLAQQIDGACGLLGEADRRLVCLPLGHLHWRHLRRGAVKKWLRCAREFSSLRADSPPEAFHAWRRQVKYAANQAQLLAGFDPAGSAMAGPRLRELASLLGHAQDLELLEALLRRQPDALRIDMHVQRLRRLLANRLVDLREQSLRAGAELFAESSQVTEQQHCRKGAATAVAEDAASSLRPVIPDRVPDSPRRRQHG